MPTATERAHRIARHIVLAAQQDNSSVVTRALLDAVMREHTDMEPGAVHQRTVRQAVRKLAASAGVRVVLTDDERYWAIREQLHHMSGDEVRALCDSIADGGQDDPRGDDQVLIDAVSVRLSNRPIPRRLVDAVPVPVPLWDELVPAPDAVGAMPPYAQHPRVVEALEILRAAEVPVATIPAREVLYRWWFGPTAPQGAFMRPEAQTLELFWFIDGALDESKVGCDFRSVRTERNAALDDMADAFVWAGWSVCLVESTRTATRRALSISVTPPSSGEDTHVQARAEDVEQRQLESDRRQVAARARAHRARFEVQQRFTNAVIEEQARAVLTQAGHVEAGERQEGFRFLTDHLVVALRAEYADGNTWSDGMDAYEVLFEAGGWHVERKRGAFCAYLSLLPTIADARSAVLEGQRRSVAAAHDEALIEHARR